MRAACHFRSIEGAEPSFLIRRERPVACVLIVAVLTLDCGRIMSERVGHLLVEQDILWDRHRVLFVGQRIGVVFLLEEEILYLVGVTV